MADSPYIVHSFFCSQGGRCGEVKLYQGAGLVKDTVCKTPRKILRF